MNKRMIIVGLMGSLWLAGGCAHDKPHEYGQERPPVGELDQRDSGLQSKDVVQASDQMAMDLLADPKLNASKTQWTIVVDRVENLTVNSRFSMDIFLERLKANLFKHGQGRVQLIENRDKLRELQSRELEGASAGSAPGPAGIQPDYSLYARVSELPNRGTSYYQMNFTLTDLHTRQVTWLGAYEVRVAR